MSYVTRNPSPPYQIPSGPSEGQRLLARWKSFNRLVKTGIVGGGLLSLVAVGAMAAPLVTSSEPSKHLPFAATTELPTTPRATTKATATNQPATTAQATEPSKTAANTIPVATKTEPTKAPTTKAVEPTKAPTTKATTPVTTSTTPKPTTPKPTTTTTTPTPTKTTTSATTKPTVVPNAVCTVAGATGVSSTGTAMICKTTTTDPQLRWRAAV